MTLPLTVASAADLAHYVGAKLGPGPGMHIGQEEVAQFCALTGDDQWIHLDRDRAANNAKLGAPIVPGNLLLSMVPRGLKGLYRVTSGSYAVLAAYRQVRFRAPVPIGSTLRLEATILSVVPRAELVRLETACALIRGADKQHVVTCSVTDVFYF